MGLELPLPDNVGPKVGLLNDKEIKQALQAGFLFAPGTYNENNAKYASYELRVGEVYETLEFKNNRVSHTPSELGEGGQIQIPPGQTVLVTAEETFKIPTDIFAKVTTVGQIFSSGLAAENTFADPGYTGPLYITLTNISSRTLSIKRHDPLARVEFHRLASPVARAHPGYAGRRPSFVIPSIDTQLRKLLVDKSVKELLEELVTKSVDDTLDRRFLRSEVLIEKAHREINRLIFEGTGIRWLWTVLITAISFYVIREFDLLSMIRLNDILKIGLSVVGPLIAGLLVFLFRKWYERRKH